MHITSHYAFCCERIHIASKRFVRVNIDSIAICVFQHNMHIEENHRQYGFSTYN